jgi:ornithine cyclodeaminase/alanine dehydrogenase-like protein (mu-crystallin family)
MRILGRHEVEEALDMASCIDACERAFAAYSTGGAELPAVIHLEVPESRGEIHVKAGHLHGFPFYAVKVASGFSASDPVAIDGLVVVFDVLDGSPAAILLDGGYLTDVRTGAAGGVAAAHLAPDDARIAAVIGSGIQARRQVEALVAVRPSIGEVRVWGRRAERAAAAAAEIGAVHGLEASAARSIRHAVEGADVVITCTASTEPSVEADWLAPGTHVTAVGSDAPGKQELNPEILRRADLLVVDSIEQCRRLGELQHALDVADRAVELGAICAGIAVGRNRPAQLTVCDLTGVGVQDVAAANVVMHRIASTHPPS